MEERAKQREEDAIARYEEAIARQEAAIRQQRALESARTRYQVAKNKFEGNPTVPLVLEAIIAEDEFLHLSTGRHERTIREAPRLFGDLLRIVSVATKPGIRAVKGKSTRYPNRSSMKKSVQDAAKLIMTSKHEIEGWEGSRANFKRILQHSFVASNPRLVQQMLYSENLLESKVRSFMARPEIFNAIRVLSEARDREANLIKTHAWYFRLVRKCRLASMLGLVSCFVAFVLAVPPTLLCDLLELGLLLGSALLGAALLRTVAHRQLRPVTYTLRHDRLLRLGCSTSRCR
jgi:hypothetical protein